MSQNVNPVNQGRKAGHIASPDVIVIGAGIFGLWAARHALKRGERVLVLEKSAVGSGASGGFLGALMPHMPDSWNAKKQMQFDALSSLEDAIEHLQSDTGMSCGYKRCGRLMPLAHEKMLDHAKRRVDGAKNNWVGTDGAQQYRMEILPPDFSGTIAEGWLSEKVAPYGATFDTLSARVNPRAYLGALAAYVTRESRGLGKIREGTEAVRLLLGKEAGSDKPCGVELRNGERISARRIVVANGWQAYDLLRKVNVRYGGQVITGRGVKGQAVLLEADVSNVRPIVYDDGSYVVPHENGQCAIGSTSVNDWMPMGLGKGDEEWASESFAGEIVRGDPLADKLVEAAVCQFDRSDMAFYKHAIALCPSLKDARIIERWANVRPRNTVPDAKTGKVGTEPIFGVLDEDNRVQLALGGFKISLGIGHVSL